MSGRLTRLRRRAHQEVVDLHVRRRLEDMNHAAGDVVGLQHREARVDLAGPLGVAVAVGLGELGLAEALPAVALGVAACR